MVSPDNQITICGVVVVLLGAFGCSETSPSANMPDSRPIERISVTEIRRLKEAGAEKGVFGVAFSPDGELLASTGDAGVHLWDWRRGKLVRSIGGRGDGRSLRVAISPDGQMLAMGTVEGTVSFWELSTGKRLWIREAHDDNICGLAFSPDGEYLLSGGGNNMALWSKMGQLVHRFVVQEGGRVQSIGFSSDGSKAFSGVHRSVQVASQIWSESRTNLYVWDVADRKELVNLDCSNTMLIGFAVLPGDKAFAMTGLTGGGIDIRDLTTGEVLRHYNGPADQGQMCMAIPPDGKVVLAGGMFKRQEAEYGVVARLSMWDMATGKRTDRVVEDKLMLHSLAVSPDGRHVASGVQEGEIIIWELKREPPELDQRN